MNTKINFFIFVLLLSATVSGKHKKLKPKKFVSPTSKGLQCYNCLSFDHPGCWDPDHPDYANITMHTHIHGTTIQIPEGVINNIYTEIATGYVISCGTSIIIPINKRTNANHDRGRPVADIGRWVPNIDCYIPGMAFLCIVITSESAKLVETGQEIGPVRARTCVPAKDFSKKIVSYSMCSKLSKELSASEIFSRIAVSRPQCSLCKKHLCTDASHC